MNQELPPNEDFSSPEARESHIERCIEELAQREGMDSGDIRSDMQTFFEIIQVDPDACLYFEILSEMTGLPIGDIVAYTEAQIAKQAQEDNSEESGSGN